MPFLCLQYRELVASSPARRWAAAALADERGSWHNIGGYPRTEIRYRQPCGVWNGAAAGLNGWLLCDGFITHPRAFDAVSPSDSLDWLGRALSLDGANALRDLEGQYAILFVDGDGDGLIAARDWLGGQTLYWHRSKDVTAVSSRSRYLARLPCCTAEENPSFISEIFAMRGQHAPGTTPFRHVNEVLPGGTFESRADDVRTVRRAFESAPPAIGNSDQAWVDAFRETFRVAVVNALGREGDVAVMLSGGLDSAPILAAASRAMREDARRTAAISWFLPGYPQSDESVWIKSAAQWAGVDLCAFDGADGRPFSALDRDAVSAELPYYNPVRGLLSGCYRMAAEESCGIVLAGTQGDMIYPGRYAVLYDLISRRDWAGLRAELGSLYHRLGVVGMYRDPAVRYPFSRALRRWRRSGNTASRDWLSDYACQHLPMNDPGPPETGSFPNPRHARVLLGPAMTFGTAQENDFCQRYGVERRDPFHNEALIRLMLHAPVALSHRQGQSKWIMREAMREHIPEELRLKRRTGVLTQFIKAGFVRNRESIRRLLLGAAAEDWSRYASPAYMERALTADSPTDGQLMAVCGCIGYVRWLKQWAAGD